MTRRAQQTPADADAEAAATRHAPAAAVKRLAAAPGLRHTLIRASAGTGKTYQLTNAFLQLLVANEPFDSILATTFTRKAAGEILDRVLTRLAEAALDPRKLADLRAAIAAPALDAAGCRALLARVVAQVHRLRVGTLDSFFQQVARSFSLELGLPPGWQIGDDHDDRRLRAAAIRQTLDEEAPGDVARLMHLLTKAEAQRSIAAQIATLVSDLYSLYLEAPPEAWRTLPRPRHIDPRQLAEACDQLAAGDGCKPALRDACQSAAELARCGDWESLLTKGVAKKVLEGESTYSRQPIPPAILDRCGTLIEEARATILGTIANQNEATFELLDRFHRAYARLKQTARTLRFEDVTRVLAGAMEARLGALPHRLDARLEHLLLDEFQDTSALQWRVLRPLAQQVARSDERLFFCVGDVKQAIYRWRGGMAEIFETLPHDLGALEQLPLDTSFRSAPPVIDCVNRVFQSLAANPALANYAAAAAAWSARFHPHATAKTALPGYCRLVVAPRAAGDAQQNLVTMRFAAAEVAALHRAAPARSLGVLCRRNEAVARLIFELKQLGVQASEEGGNPLTDAASVQLALAALRLADHPGDSAARYHLIHSPLAAWLALGDIADDRAAQRAARRLRQALIEDGYGPTLYECARHLAPHCDSRDLERLLQLVETGYAYAAKATLRADDFIALVEQQRVPAPRPAAIRVMTLHQAKGLQFDTVVLPELEWKLRGQPGSVVVGRRPGDGIQHVCRHVNEKLRPLLPDALQAMFADDQRQQVEEALSVLYVALTRPVHALHMIVSPPKANEKKIPATAAGVLRAALASDGAEGAVLFEAGDAAWPACVAADAPATESAPPAPLVVRFAPPKPRGRRGLEPQSPSQLEAGAVVRLDEWLRLPDAAARDLGRLVHRWFAEIEWLDTGPPAEDLLRAIAGDPEYRGVDIEEALRRFRGGIVRQEIAAALSRPREALAHAEIELWRERAFAVRDGDALLHGRFDRVLLRRTGTRFVAAEVLDFKTDRVPAEAVPLRAQLYLPQMAAYRRAVARMTGLPGAAITAKLLFVEPGVVLPLAEEDCGA